MSRIKLQIKPGNDTHFNGTDYSPLCDAIFSHTAFDLKPAITNGVFGIVNQSTLECTFNVASDSENSEKIVNLINKIQNEKDFILVLEANASANGCKYYSYEFSVKKIGTINIHPYGKNNVSTAFSFDIEFVYDKTNLEFKSK